MPRACTRNVFVAWSDACSPKDVVALVEPAPGVKVHTAFTDPFANRLFEFPWTAWTEERVIPSGRGLKAQAYACDVRSHSSNWQLRVELAANHPLPPPRKERGS